MPFHVDFEKNIQIKNYFYFYVMEVTVSLTALK